MNNKPKVKLTQYSSGAGWACKIPAKELTQVLSKLNQFNDGKSIFKNFDDCAIFKINDRQSIIQTVDFFTPIVDDPYTFGQIGAANSLSDIYAMGGKPLFALNITAFPTDTLNLEILTSILKGGEDKCLEAGINILGGHSIKDDSPKYGLAVTSIINNDKILKNNGAQINDNIILTKPLGTGIITTAIKKGLASNKSIDDVIEVMASLNDTLEKIEDTGKINACTDITGYGLIGHLNEVCSASDLTAEINFSSIPFIENVEKLAADGVIPGGSKNNLDYFSKNVEFKSNIQLFEKLMFSDAQTSGGLLLFIPENQSEKIINLLDRNSIFKSAVIGKITKKQKKSIILYNE